MKRLWNNLRLFFAILSNRYEAAAWHPSRSWLPGGVVTAREDISKSTREEIVRRSRYFEKNSDLYNKLADLWEQYTVGQGLQFYATTTNPGWNALADGAWERWKPFADISSRFHFDTLQGVIARAMFIDGEVFVIKTKGDGNRARIQILEGPLCKTPDSLRAREGKDIIDGIQVDANGRPEKYWFVLEKDAQPVDFPAFAVEHLFEPSRPGQMRGLPYIACALNTLQDLDDLQMLEMQASKLACEIANVETNSSGELDAMANWRARVGFRATGENATASTTPVFADYKVSVGSKNIALKTGDKLENFMVNRPTVVTQQYWTKLEEKVCAGVGIPHVMVYPDSMQGTVYRGSLDAAAAFFRCKSSVVAGFIRRIREFAINAEGAFFAPLANRPPDWQSCDYLPPAAPNTDVGYNSAAAIAELKAGIKSWDDILLPQGRKAEPVLRRKAALQVMIKKLAQELSRDGITITPEEIANIDITPLPGGGDPSPDDEPTPPRRSTPKPAMKPELKNSQTSVSAFGRFRLTNSLRARKPAAPVMNRSTIECQGCRIEVQWNDKDEAATIAILDSIGKDPWGEGGFTEKDFRNALKDIPRNKELNLLINSRGGDVFEGFGIKNAIAEWPNRVTATITGVAASTASWMILDADEVRAPKASQMFIHEAMTIGAGNAEDLREVADRLDTTSEQIAGFYAAKNGKPAAEMRELMKKNTLMTGAQARELGLVDVLTDDAPTHNFLPAELQAMNRRLAFLNSAPEPGANNNQPKGNTVNREHKLALLKEWGVSYENTISDTDLDALIAKGKPVAAPNTDADKRVIALENRLREAETRRVTGEFNEIAKTRPTINREEWLPKVIADATLLNVLRDFPEAPEPMPVGGFNRIENKGNPLIEKYNDPMINAVERGAMAKRHYADLRRELMIANGIREASLITNARSNIDRFDYSLPAVRNANTVDAALANTILSGDFVTTMRTYIAPWAAFTRAVATHPISRRQTLEVPLASSAGSKQQNATNYETGDSVLAPIAVTVAEESKSFHISRPEQNLGLALAALVPTNAKVLAEGIHAKMTALMIAANYGAATVIGAAANFDSGDLPAILALGKNYDQVRLLLDGGHLAYLLPTSRESFIFGEPGAYGFDGGIFKNNLWTGGVANICGFVCGPDAIVNAWGMADGLPAGESISQTTVDVNGIPFGLSVWFSRATRAVWASFQVMHGCAVGDATQGENLVTA